MLTLSALAAGCAPNLGPPPQVIDTASLAVSRSFAAPETAWPGDSWWKAYGDPQLDALIAEGLASAPDLKIAEARVRLAAAQAQRAGGALSPSLNAEGSVTSVRQSLNEGFPEQFHDFLPQGWNEHGEFALGLQYQLDFFGKNRAALAAATSEAEAARVDSAAARLQLAAAIATGYADLQRLYADRAAAEDALRVRTDSAKLVAQRLDAGLENEGRNSQSNAEVSGARADLDAVDLQITLQRNALAALLGKGPDRGLDIAPPAAPQTHPLGLPPALSADLIGRRPDIVAARLRAQAAASRIKMAKADFYPNVNLTALVGQQALGLDLLTQGDSRFGSVGPAINLPLFTGGKLEGAYRGARAEYDAAVASYDGTLVNALREVADALASRKSLAAELKNARDALAASEDAYRVQRLRYEGGLSTYLDALTVENTVLARRRNVADLEARAFALDVALIKALGGGYVASPAQAASLRTHPDA